MNSQARKQLANAYPRLLVLEKEAQRRGIENDPHYVESLKFVKMQLLNQELNRQMQEEASKIPDSELQDYYEKNSKNFEQAALQRVYVPRNKQLEPPNASPATVDQQAAEKAGEAAMAQVAADLRARTAAGEDFDKLEKAAYEAAGIKSNPPSTAIPKIRRVNLPRSHADVFNLNAGDVSQIINDPSGYYFYKVQAKSVPTLDEVKPEIRAVLQNQRMREAVQKLESSVTTELNDAYFNSSPAPLPGTAKPAMPADQEHRPNTTEPQE
jgi:peptidyl-prolyl cis-trans isomerase C